MLFINFCLNFFTNTIFTKLIDLQDNVLKNQKNCFLLQTAILIFAILLKITDENIIQLVKTIH